MSDHTSKQFDAEMEEVRSGVLSMGGLVERQIARGIALLGEEPDRRVVEAVGADEQEINQLQVDIDQLCSQIIARRQPTAIDLRMIMTVSKIVNDLERIGDEMKKVAYKASRVEDVGRLRSLRSHDVERMARGVQQMLQKALDAFARLDVNAVAEVVAEDKAIDRSFNAIMRQLISFMMEDPRTISEALEVVFIAKSIERIGDHAKNIAESVVHVVTGKDLRHATADEIRAEVAQE
jgi:phosphate transport system protein